MSAILLPTSLVGSYAQPDWLINRDMLGELFDENGLGGSAEERRAIADCWHRLDAWKDVGPGFARLRTRVKLCPCSNGNIALMADIGRRNDLRWHAVLGSEIAQAFKPTPRVYLASATSSIDYTKPLATATRSSTG